MPVALEQANDALWGWRSLAEDGGGLARAASSRSSAPSVRTQQHLLRRQADVVADLGGDHLVVTGEDLDQTP